MAQINYINFYMNKHTREGMVPTSLIECSKFFLHLCMYCSISTPMIVSAH